MCKRAELVRKGGATQQRNDFAYVPLFRGLMPLLYADTRSSPLMKLGSSLLFPLSFCSLPPGERELEKASASPFSPLKFALMIAVVYESLLRTCRHFQLREPGERLLPAAPTHLERGLEAGATTRAFRLAEEGAPGVIRQLNTLYSRRFSSRHAGDRS
jgi:hypothetical protein